MSPRHLIATIKHPIWGARIRFSASPVDLAKPKSGREWERERVCKYGWRVLFRSTRKGPSDSIFCSWRCSIIFFQTSCLRLTRRLLTLGVNIIVVVVSTNKRHPYRPRSWWNRWCITFQKHPDSTISQIQLLF